MGASIQVGLRGPRGDQLAFRKQNKIGTMNADGSERRWLSKDSTGRYAKQALPSWSPDGITIVFRAVVTKNYDIFIANSDGTDVRNLTNSRLGDADRVGRPTAGGSPAYVADLAACLR